MPQFNTHSYTSIQGESSVISRKYVFKKVVLPAVLTLVVLLSGSCAHTTVHESAGPGVPIPETFSVYDETTPAPDRWWEGFGSDELNRLINSVLEDSLTLRQSLSRLEQVRALATQAGAARFPDLNLNAGVSDTWRNSGSGTATSRSRSLTLVSSYELDFWGRIRAGHHSAVLEVEASREELYTAAQTLASEVTLKWLEVISVHRQIELLKDQLETNLTILDLVELRYLKGLATALDIYQQRQAVAETEASFPQLEAQLQTLGHELAVLAGRPPGTDLGFTANVFPEPGPLPGTGVPADLLSKRPDLRAAGLKLRSAEGQVAAARAARLPAMNLSATTGFGSDRFSDLLENWLASLAASITMPLFNAGALKTEVERQERIVEERLASYGHAVLTAVREVEDAMVREIRQVEYIEALRKQLQISQDGYREALARYRKGLSDYLPVLSALSGTQRLERSIVIARFARLTYRVALHRALGGDWMEEELEEKVESRK